MGFKDFGAAAWDFITPGKSGGSAGGYDFTDAFKDTLDFFLPGDVFKTPLDGAGVDAWDIVGAPLKAGKEFVGSFRPDKTAIAEQEEVVARSREMIFSDRIKEIRGQADLDPDIKDLSIERLKREYIDEPEKSDFNLFNPMSYGKEELGLLVTLGLGAWQIAEEKEQFKKQMKAMTPEAQAEAEVKAFTTRKRLMEEAGFDYYGRPLTGSGGGGGGASGGGVVMDGVNVFAGGK